MQISSIIRRAVAGVAAASMLVAVAACGTSKDNKTAGGEGGSGTIEVVASINQWGSVAKDLGGSHVDVTNNNEADALVLAAMGADHLGAPLVDLPQTHRAALDAVQWPTRGTM